MAYRVKRQFMDRRGHARKPGELFETDDHDEIDRELATGNIEEVPDVPPGTGRQPGGGERGGAPA